VIPRAARGSAILLDGGMGTALIDRGLPPACLPEEWVVEHPGEVSAVHRAHRRAGAQVLLTCTFNLARLDVAASSLDRSDVARRAVALARSAGGTTVAGCVGATGLTRGDGSGPPAAEFEDRYGAAFRALASAGVEILWLETQLDLGEARAALKAARRTGLPLVATATLRPGPDGMEGFDGTPGLTFLEVLWREGAAAVGVNCVAPDATLARFLASAANRIPVPLVAKPNAGLPGEPVGPVPFAAGAMAAVRAGARMVGGCCGAGGAHLHAAGISLGPGRYPRAG